MNAGRLKRPFVECCIRPKLRGAVGATDRWIPSGGAVYTRFNEDLTGSPQGGIPTECPQEVDHHADPRQRLLHDMRHCWICPS